jgi:hypothetical protein
MKNALLLCVSVSCLLQFACADTSEQLTAKACTHVINLWAKEDVTAKQREVVDRTAERRSDCVKMLKELEANKAEHLSRCFLECDFYSEISDCDSSSVKSSVKERGESKNSPSEKVGLVIGAILGLMTILFYCTVVYLCFLVIAEIFGAKSLVFVLALAAYVFSIIMLLCIYHYGVMHAVGLNQLLRLGSDPVYEISGWPRIVLFISLLIQGVLCAIPGEKFDTAGFQFGSTGSPFTFKPNHFLSFLFVAASIYVLVKILLWP